MYNIGVLFEIHFSHSCFIDVFSIITGRLFCFSSPLSPIMFLSVQITSNKGKSGILYFLDYETY